MPPPHSPAAPCRAAARVRAMTGFSFNKAVFKPFMYKFSDHLSGKSAQLPSVAVQCPVAGIHSSSDNIIDYRWWVGGRLGGWNLVCQKQKRISLTTQRSVPNTHWGQRLLRVLILTISRDFLSDIKFVVLPIGSKKLHSLGYLHHILYIIFK